MPLFRREYELSIGDPDSDGVLITRLQIDFEIVKTLESDGNSCRIMIYNMNPDTRGRINDKDLTVILKAGYEGDLKTIFTGSTVRTSSVRQGENIETEVICKDGYISLRESRSNRNFPPKSTVELILRTLITGDLKLAIGEVTGDNLDNKYQSGLTVDGPTKRAMDKIVKSHDLQWSVQDGSVDIIGKTASSKESVILVSPKTGLIGSPEPQDGNQDNLEGSETISNGVTFKTLLNGAIRPGRPVKVESEFVNATYKVTKVTHRGSFRGNSWETDVEGDQLGNA